MRKIDRLKLALKTGAFWSMFKPAPVVDSTPNQCDEQEKAHDLWAKYRNLIWKYGDDNRRFMALYDAHHRDLMRLLNKQETHAQ
jgi:hypothetical protein